MVFVLNQKMKIILWFLMLSSCFPSNKRRVIDDQTYDDPLMNFTQEVLNKMYEEMRTEYENNLIYLHMFKEINKRFCNILKDQKNDCDITKRISNSGGFEVQCEEEGGLKQSKVIIKVRFDIPGKGEVHSKKFYFEINDEYTSDNFSLSDEKIQEIQFSNSLNVYSKKFYQIYKIVVKSEDPSLNFPNPSDVTAQLFVNGTNILQSGAPSEIRDQNNKISGLKFNLVEMNKLFNSNCSKTFDSLNKIKKKVSDDYESKAVSLNWITEDRCKPLDQSNISHQKLINHINQCKLYHENLNDLTRSEIDKQYVLQDEIRTDNRVGCHIHDTINSFVVSMDIHRKNNIFVRDSLLKEVGPQSNDSSKASQLYFDFGGVNFNLDYSKNNYENYNYELNESQINKLKIESINKISVKKNAVKYNNLKKPCTNLSGIFGTITSMLDKRDCYDVYEEDVFDIKSIVIKINDRDVYHSSINETLNHKKLLWRGDIHSNEKWLKFMSEKNCIK